jgi:hypothetical protein
MLPGAAQRGGYRCIVRFAELGRAMAADGSRCRAGHLPAGTPLASCGHSMKARRNALWSAWIVGAFLAATSCLLGDAAFAATAQVHTWRSTYQYDAQIPASGGALHNVQVRTGAATSGSNSAASEGAQETVTTATGPLCVASRSCVAANSGSRALVDAGKYDYLFGRVASGSHNAARSAQNAQQWARIGVHDNAAGRSLLSSHFDDVIARNDNIARTFTSEHGTFQIRDSLFSGPGGFLKFESTWQVTDDGLRLTTVIPMGGP